MSIGDRGCYLSVSDLPRAFFTKDTKGSLSGMLLASGSLYKEYTLVREAGAVLMAEERALPSILVKCLDPGLMEVLTDSRRLR